MTAAMRPLMISLVLAAACALPLTALATDAPAPAVVAACQAEAAQLGKDAFVAKYGPTEPFGHCFAAHASVTTTATATTTTTTTPNADDGPRSFAQAFCGAANGPCLRKARQLVAACKASSGSNRDAFRACLASALSSRRR